jgi:hypothetical protein
MSLFAFVSQRYEERFLHPIRTLRSAPRQSRGYGFAITDIQMNCLWWDRLELMYQAEQAVWRIFCGG